MKIIIAFFSLLAFFLTNLQAQTRYIDEVFSTVDTTADITYGTNIDVITGMPASLNLKLDLYEPAGDTAAERPVVIVVHGGSFLPVPINGYCTGTKTDSQIVEISTRLAKYGYVVAAIDYRMGWNPVSGDQNTRTGTYLNAFYRVVQDIRNAVRFFKWSYDNGNPYSIANDKISVIGEGSGAFCAVAAGCLDSYDEISLAKFINPSTTQSYIDTSLSGNSYGTQARPLNIANYPTYSSDLSFIGNLGGVAGDSTWIEAGEPPMASIHCPSDPFRPYIYGAVIVQVTGDFLINVSGSYDIQRISNTLGNNNVYINAGFNDPITQIANSRNNGRYGLFPMPRSGVEFAPWQWWDATCTNHSNSIVTNPDMSKTKALAYIDTILWYLTPRMAMSNGLISLVEVEELSNEKLISVFPNPASNFIHIEVIQGNLQMQAIEIIDISGRIVYAEKTNATSRDINLNEIPKGIYILEITLDNTKVLKKLVIE